MNKRIFELSEQAKLRSPLLLQYWGKIGALTDSEQEELENIEKFAELIVQDCISQIAMIGVSNCDDPDVVWIVDKAIHNIREHFGVEE